MTQIARERFPEAFPGEEALAALASRVLVYNPPNSQALLSVLGQVGALSVLGMLARSGRGVCWVCCATCTLGADKQRCLSLTAWPLVLSSHHCSTQPTCPLSCNLACSRWSKL